MKIFLTGATGFIGRALVQRLLRDGHELTAWVRDPAAARSKVGPEVDLVEVGAGDEVLARALADQDAVVNLAGDPLFKGRWNAAKKERMVTSRVDLTRRLVRAMEGNATRPDVLVSASAIGLYGDRGDEELSETSAPATGYLPDLCRDWEAAATEAEALGVRVATVRIGIVLGIDGGALESMLPPFRMGVGGPLGSGRQVMSWIHLDDMVELLVTAVTDARYRGPFNATAPVPVTNKEFSKALGRVLHRPAFLPAPAVAVRLLLGEAAQVVLGGQKVLPRKALDLGFRFRFAHVEPALRDVLSHGDTVTIESAGNLPEGEYLARRGARYRLTQTIELDAPKERIFDFFGRAENLGLVTPGWLNFEILGPPPEEMKAGVELEYRIWLGPLPLSWKTVIEHWEEGSAFVDAQYRGPYVSWWHEHRFREEGGRTIVEDTVYYSPPLGPLAWIANLFVAPSLRAIFGYRHEAITRRFPAPGSRVTEAYANASEAMRPPSPPRAGLGSAA